MRRYTIFSCMASPDPSCFFVPSRIPLQYKRDDGNYNEDYYEPFCDFHGETGYSLQAQYKKNQSKY
jgi:hypothetical protein